MNNEYEIAEMLLSYSPEKIRLEFECIKDKDLYTFVERNNPSHYIHVYKKKKEAMDVPVIISYDFNRVLGSNHVRKFSDVGRKFVSVFGIEDIEWIKNN